MNDLPHPLNLIRHTHNQPVDLASIDAGSSPAFPGDKERAKDLADELNKQLEHLQELLYAQGKHRVLVVLQGMDTSGKDGTIRRVFEGVNPQGVKVVGFKAPTPEELAHDYLWRIHPNVPGKGQITIFNRSHYEDVLVVRVKNLVPQSVWERRYEHINAFEKMLSDEGVTILKFFLHISKDEQKERLLERQSNPEKHWKFNPGDLADRALWNEFQHAYADMLKLTSTSHAPWHIIPANRKWLRDVLILQVLVHTLEKFDMTYPPGPADIASYSID